MKWVLRLERLLPFEFHGVALVPSMMFLASRHCIGCRLFLPCFCPFLFRFCNFHVFLPKSGHTTETLVVPIKRQSGWRMVNGRICPTMFMFTVTCQRAKAPKVHCGPTQHTWGPLFTRRGAAEESIKIPDRNKLARVGTFHRCISISAVND